MMSFRRLLLHSVSRWPPVRRDLNNGVELADGAAYLQGENSGCQSSAVPSAVAARGERGSWGLNDRTAVSARGYSSERPATGSLTGENLPSRLGPVRSSYFYGGHHYRKTE